MTTGEDTHGCDYFTPLFLLPQLCNSTLCNSTGYPICDMLDRGSTNYVNVRSYLPLQMGQRQKRKDLTNATSAGARVSSDNISITDLS